MKKNLFFSQATLIHHNLDKDLLKNIESDVLKVLIFDALPH